MTGRSSQILGRRRLLIVEQGVHSKREFTWACRVKRLSTKALGKILPSRVTSLTTSQYAPDDCTL